MTAPPPLPTLSEDLDPLLRSSCACPPNVGIQNFFDTIPPPPPYVRVWMTAPPPPRSPPYLKVWFRHCRLLALLMLVYKIWRVNCDKQDWKDEEMGQKLKKQRRVEVSQLFLPETVALVTIQNSDNER